MKSVRRVSVIFIQKSTAIVHSELSLSDVESEQHLLNEVLHSLPKGRNNVLFESILVVTQRHPQLATIRQCHPCHNDRGSNSRKGIGKQQQPSLSLTRPRGQALQSDIAKPGVFVHSIQVAKHRQTHQRSLRSWRKHRWVTLLLDWSSRRRSDRSRFFRSDRRNFRCSSLFNHRRRSSRSNDAET